MYIRGDIIIEQGAPGKKLFIIEKGSVDVFVMNDNYNPIEHQPTEPGLPTVGRKVIRLSAGDPFGERALMQSKPRSASCVAVENTTCFVLDRERFLQAIESIEIFDGFGYEDRDRSDVLALGRHIDKFQRMQSSFVEMRKVQTKASSSAAASAASAASSNLRRTQSMQEQELREAENKRTVSRQKTRKRRDSTPKNIHRGTVVVEENESDSSEDEDTDDDEDEDEDDDNIERKHSSLHQRSVRIQTSGDTAGGLKLQDGLLHLMSAFSPECDDNDTTERIVKTLYRLCRVERIGMFLCDWTSRQLILSIAREGGARGIRIPMKGIAGHVAQSGRVVNVLDASKEPRFNDTMDKQTGFKTKTILCVPIRSHNGNKKVLGKTIF